MHSDVLEDDGEALADADADRGDSPALAGLLQGPGEGAEDPGPGRAERVPDRDGAAGAVDDLRVDVPGVDAGQRLGGEGLVQLDRADVAPPDAGPLEREVGRLDRREAEVLR